MAADGEQGAASLGKGGDLIGKLADIAEEEDTAKEAATQIFRVVGPEEAADIAESGVYRNRTAGRASTSSPLRRKLRS